MSLLSPPLQAFLAIVRQGTVHSAAPRLGLTQTAVTQRIRSLEAGLGATLFLRSRRGMKMTAEGQALFRYCQSVEELEGIALSQIHRAAVEFPIQLSLIGPTSVMTSRVARHCIEVYRKWPLLDLNFIISDGMARVDQLRTGQADLAIVSPGQVPKEMDSKLLRPDRYILVASAKWKGRRLDDILARERIIDFDAQDPTTLNYLKKFKLTSKHPPTRVFANNNEVIIQLFSQGIGFGTLTQEVAQPHLETGKLIALNGGAATEEPLALAWYPRPQMPPYLASLIRAIR